MSRKLTASDRKSLIRLASTMPVGSPERKVILAGLDKRARDWPFPRSQVDYNGAAKQIANALRRSEVVSKVKLGRDRGMFNGKQVIILGDSNIDRMLVGITKALKSLGYKGFYPDYRGLFKVWGKIDEAIWVDGENGYDLGYEPSGQKEYVLGVRTWPSIGGYAPESKAILAGLSKSAFAPPKRKGKRVRIMREYGSWGYYGPQDPETGDSYWIPLPVGTMGVVTHREKNYGRAPSDWHGAGSGGSPGGGHEYHIEFIDPMGDTFRAIADDSDFLQGFVK